MGDIRRKYLDGNPVFITQVTVGRTPVFSKLRERERALAILRNVQVLHPFAMHGWVILPDHFHLLITPATGETHSRIMHSFKTAFTNQYKQAHGLGEPTSIWQKRYFDTVITFEAAFYERLDYIHRNPAKHGLCRDPHEWRDSSIHAHITRGNKPDIFLA